MTTFERFPPIREIRNLFPEEVAEGRRVSNIQDMIHFSAKTKFLGFRNPCYAATLEHI